MMLSIFYSAKVSRFVFEPLSVRRGVGVRRTLRFATVPPKFSFFIVTSPLCHTTINLNLLRPQPLPANNIFLFQKSRKNFQSLEI